MKEAIRDVLSTAATCTLFAGIMAAAGAAAVFAHAVILTPAVSVLLDYSGTVGAGAPGAR
jgi:hypothetical protein